MSKNSHFIKSEFDLIHQIKCGNVSIEERLRLLID